MADLRCRDRGQIILIAAFALAVIFLTLALVVNSAIFTENLASRSDTTGSDTALMDRAVFEVAVGEALEAANRNNNTVTDQRQAVRTSLASYRTQIGQQQATSGKLTNVSFDSSRDGVRIVDDSGTFESGGPLANYALVTGISRTPNGNGTRAFVINATSVPTSSGGAFNISVVGSSGARWTTKIWDDTGEVVVETERVDTTGTVTASDNCRVAAGDTSAPVIDVTDGTVNGRPCDALGTTESGTNLHFGAGTDAPYTIRFENAANIEGRYSLVVYNDGLGSINTGGNDEPALYQVNVTYSYTTNDVRYVTEIRVAPGEPDA